MKIRSSASRTLHKIFIVEGMGEHEKYKKKNNKIYYFYMTKFYTSLFNSEYCLS